MTGALVQLPERCRLFAQNSFFFLAFLLVLMSRKIILQLVSQVTLGCFATADPPANQSEPCSGTDGLRVRRMVGGGCGMYRNQKRWAQARTAMPCYMPRPRLSVYLSAVKHIHSTE